MGGNFNYSENKLISLQGCPKMIGEGFYCSDNQLISLEFSPLIIKGNFDCKNNQIISLKDFPEKIDGLVHFSSNQELLKYKESNIQDMSDEDFLEQQEFQFWHQFHLQEKFKKENNQLIDELNLHDKIQNKYKYYNQNKK